MSKNRKKKTEKIGKLNPNLIKTRDIVHMLEFLANKGGPHKNKRQYNRKRDQRQAQNEDLG